MDLVSLQRTSLFLADFLTVDFTSTPSRFYILERSDDLRTWVDSGLGVFLPNAGSQTSKTFGLSANAIRQFVRVRPVKPLPARR